jgi:hypothetical protein
MERARRRTPPDRQRGGAALAGYTRVQHCVVCDVVAFGLVVCQLGEVSSSEVPEPGTLGLLALGLMGAGVVSHRRAAARG